MNKRGLSDIVTTVLIILVVFVAAIIIWIAVSRLMYRENVDSHILTATVDTNGKSVFCNDSIKTVYMLIEKRVGAENVSAVDVVLYDLNGDSCRIRVNKTLKELETVKLEVNYSNCTTDKFSKIDVYPVVIDFRGNVRVAALSARFLVSWNSNGSCSTVPAGECTPSDVSRCGAPGTCKNYICPAGSCELVNLSGPQPGCGNCVNGDCPPTQVCIAGTIKTDSCGTSSIGECRLGTQNSTCKADGSGWNAPGACVGSVNPVAENCTDGKDNNCNGLFDCADIDSCSADSSCGTAECNPGETLSVPCGNYSLGICRLGTQTRTCSAGGTWGSWSSCIGNIDPGALNCTNGLDNNCDGVPDFLDPSCGTPYVHRGCHDNMCQYIFGSGPNTCNTLGSRCTDPPENCNCPSDWVNGRACPNVCRYAFICGYRDSCAFIRGVCNCTECSLGLNPQSLPNGTVGILYSQTVNAVNNLGAPSPYTFYISAGSLPAGLNLNSNGTIFGTPTTAGVYRFNIGVESGNACQGKMGYEIEINPAVQCPVINLTRTSLPEGIVGTAYSQTLGASGGVSPYTYSVSSGALPSGLTLSPSGTISGTPTTAGTYVFGVKAEDSNGCYGTQKYQIVVNQTTGVCPTDCSGSPSELPVNLDADCGFFKGDSRSFNISKADDADCFWWATGAGENGLGDSIISCGNGRWYLQLTSMGYGEYPYDLLAEKIGGSPSGVYTITQLPTASPELPCNVSQITV